MSSITRLLGRVLVGALGLASLSSAGVLRSRVSEGVKIEYTEVSLMDCKEARQQYLETISSNQTTARYLRDNSGCQVLQWIFNSSVDSPSAVRAEGLLLVLRVARLSRVRPVQRLA